MSDAITPTIQDIAVKVGVSKGAVSVVLNGSTSSTRVSAVTRDRILAVAEELNYRPNVAAQALSRGRMDTIGIMFGFTNDSAPLMSRALAMDILQGASAAAERADKNLMLFTQRWRSQNGGSHRRLSDERTDGLIVSMPATDGDMITQLMAQPQPLVFIGYPADKRGHPSVDVDNASGAALATRHLLELGHRRIAHLQGDDFYVCTGERLSGFLQTMLEAGIVTPPEYVLQGSYDGTTAARGHAAPADIAEPAHRDFCRERYDRVPRDTNGERNGISRAGTPVYCRLRRHCARPAVRKHSNDGGAAVLRNGRAGGGTALAASQWRRRPQRRNCCLTNSSFAALPRREVKR